MPINQDIDYLSAANLDNNTLLARLLIAQQDIREILMKYRIPPSNVSAMARLSRKLISNSDVRAKFLENLIELQDLGAEAKTRSLLGEAKMTASGLISAAAADATMLRKKGHQVKPVVIKAEIIANPTIAPVFEIGGQVNAITSGTSKEFFESLDIKLV